MNNETETVMKYNSKNTTEDIRTDKICEYAEYTNELYTRS